MTRQKMPDICDFCGNDIAVGATEYKAQFSQKGGGKGNFVKAMNDADVCHKCFIKICETGYKPNFHLLTKNDETGKWDDKGEAEGKED